MRDFSEMEDPFADISDPFASTGGDDFSGMTDPFADISDPFAASPEPEKPALPEDAEPTWEDYGRGVMAGGAEVMGGFGWLMRKAGEQAEKNIPERFGVDDPGIGKFLKTHGSAVQEMSQDAADYWREGMTDTTKQLSETPFLKENPDALLGYEWGDLSADQAFDKAKLMMAESTLGTAAGMATGGAATAALKVLPGVSAGVAATLGFSGGEALVAAPSAGAQAEEMVREMSLADLSKHPEYQALIADGVAPEVAHATLASAAGGDAAAITAVSTAILSSPFGKVLDDIAGGVNGVFSGFFKGAATEATQEALQSGSEQMSINQAVRANADATRSLWADVPEAVAGGTFAGAQMGGAMGAAGGYTAERQQARQAEIDRWAEEVARAAELRGGDAMDQELARMEVYSQWESGVEMPLEPEMPPAGGPAEGTVDFMPYAPGIDAMRQGAPMAEDGFASDEHLPYATPDEVAALQLVPLDEPEEDEDFGNTIEFMPNTTMDDKAANVERAIRDYPYEQLMEIPERDGVPPPDDSREPTIPAAEEADQSERQAMEGRIAQISRELEEKRPKFKPNAPPSEEMPLLQAIAHAGGISRDEAEAQGIDPAEFQRQVGIRRVFTTRGRSFDQMAEHMSELGFQEEGAYSANELLDQVSRAMGGDEIYSTRSRFGKERQILRDEQERIEVELSDFERNRLDDEQDLPPFAWESDDEKRLTYALMEADLVGLDEADVYAIIDRAGTDGEAADALQEEINLERAVRKHLSGATAPAPVAEGAPEGRDAQEAPRPAQEQAEEAFQLDSYTEEDIQAREQTAAEAESEPADVPPADDFVLAGSERDVDQLEARGQNSLFDLQPAQNSDLVEQVAAWQAELNGLRALAEGKDPAQTKPVLDEIDALTSGMQETLDSGAGLAELPTEDQVKKAINRTRLRLNNARTVDEAAALEARIAAGRAERDERLKREGDLSQPITELGQIVDNPDSRVWQSDAVKQLDWSPAIAKMEDARQQLNEAGVYDTTQTHRAREAGKDISLGAITGAVERLARDIAGYVSGDKRRDPRWRIESMRENGDMLGMDLSPLFDLNAEAAKYGLTPKDVDQQANEEFKAWLADGDTTAEAAATDRDARGQAIKARQLNKRLEVLDSILGCVMS